MLGSWCFYGSCIRERVCVRLLLHSGRRPNRQVATRLSSPGFYYLEMTFLLFILYKENLFKLKPNEKYSPPEHNFICIIGAQVYLHSSLRRQQTVNTRRNMMPCLKVKQHI